ncbi:hypothetical protein ACIBSV_15385 [Embleya sp. NPDC050154]|uniref:hypothetical protein n=1 Tax=Embleya sp. NPDC050154 TaxID=3363988 RepID=UPI0037AF9FB4
MRRPGTMPASLAALQALLSMGPELPEIDRWEVREPHTSVDGEEITVSGMLAVHHVDVDERAIVADVARLMGGTVAERPSKSTAPDCVFVHAYFVFAGARFTVWTVVYESAGLDAVGSRS